MPRLPLVLAAALSLLSAGAARADCSADQLSCTNTCGQSPSFRVGGPLAERGAQRCRIDCARSYRTCRRGEGPTRTPTDQERREAERRGREMRPNAAKPARPASESAPHADHP